MSIKNHLIDRACGFLKRFKTSEIEINLRTYFGSPEENTEELLHTVTEDFDAMRSRRDEETLFVGRFLSLMLLIELKLVNLLERVDADIESKVLGRKIDVYKELLKELAKLETDLDADDLKEYQELIGPLKELAAIRNRMAHDLRYIRFDLQDLRMTLATVRKERPNWATTLDQSPEAFKALMAANYFGFIFSEKAAHIQMMLN